MCDELEAIMPDVSKMVSGADPKTRGKKWGRKKIYLAPRYSYKTSLLIAFMIFCIFYYKEHGYDIAIDYVRADRSLANDVLFELKMALETNELIIELWGELKRSAKLWSESRINLGRRRDPTISVSGLDFGGAGKHPDIVILDDIVNEKNFQSIKAKRAAKNKIQAYYPIIPPWGAMVDTGTRFAHDDVHGWLLDLNEKARRKQKLLLDEASALAGDQKKRKLAEAENAAPQWEEYIRAVKDASGNLFFPAVLNDEFLERQQAIIEAKMYAAWYLNRPDVEGMTRFRLEYLQYFTARYSRWPFPVIELVREVNGRQYSLVEIPVRVTMTIDPTVTATGTSDWTGITVVATDADDTWWTLVARRYLQVPSEIGQRAVELIRQYVPSVVYIESAQADADMVARIQRAITEEKIPTLIKSYHPLRDERAGSAGRPSRRKKSARIEALEPRFRNRQIWLHRNTCEALYDQYKNWPDIEHDDVLDALSMQYGIANPCRYSTVTEAAGDVLDALEDEQPGQIFEEYRTAGEPGRLVGRAGLSSQRLKTA
ncbi:MAG: hypothetical protein WCE44_02670 [Candidatus Velthaea sp.]